MHKAAFAGTTLLVDYVAVKRMSWLKEQFDKHPRIMLPLVGVLATILSLILFDPIRSYCTPDVPFESLLILVMKSSKEN